MLGFTNPSSCDLLGTYILHGRIHVRDESPRSMDSILISTGGVCTPWKRSAIGPDASVAISLPRAVLYTFQHCLGCQKAGCGIGPAAGPPRGPRIGAGGYHIPYRLGPLRASGEPVLVPTTGPPYANGGAVKGQLPSTDLLLPR